MLLLQGAIEDLPETVSRLGCFPLAERGLTIGRQRRLLLPIGIFAAAILITAVGVVCLVTYARLPIGRWLTLKRSLYLLLGAYVLLVMVVMVPGRIVTAFADVGVGVEMDRAVMMMVDVEVDPLLDQTPQYIDTEPDQHDADQQFKQLRHALGHHGVEDQHDGAEQEQGQGVPQTPGGALADGVGDRSAARRQGSHCGDMIALHRMAHADQESQQKQTQAHIHKA